MVVALVKSLIASLIDHREASEAVRLSIFVFGFAPDFSGTSATLYESRWFRQAEHGGVWLHWTQRICGICFHFICFIYSNRLKENVKITAALKKPLIKNRNRREESITTAKAHLVISILDPLKFLLVSILSSEFQTPLENSPNISLFALF